MLDRLRRVDGDVLDAQAYLDDFWAHWGKIEDVFWKLERKQTFREPDSASWLAMVDGRWDEALRLHEARRASVVGHYRRVAEIGFEPRRLRIVERPISPYLQWECHALKIRVEAGERIRVLEAERLRAYETNEPVPELVLLGRNVLYEVLYDDTGTLEGARRITRQDAIQDCREELASLYQRAEGFMEFFGREIVPLPPSRGQPDTA